MIEYMKSHSDLAKNQLKGNDAKQRAHTLWKNLTEILNAEGPPIRTVEKWKKVSLIKDR